VSESVYEIRIPFESQNASLPIQIIHSNTAVATGDFVKRYTVGERFSSFLNWKLQINDNPACIKAMSICIV
jgi:hypothetical protein